MVLFRLLVREQVERVREEFGNAPLEPLCGIPWWADAMFDTQRGETWAVEE